MPQTIPSMIRIYIDFFVFAIEYNIIYLSYIISVYE